MARCTGRSSAPSPVTTTFFSFTFTGSPERDSEECVQPLLVGLQGARHLAVVVAIRLERRADFLLRVVEQAADLRGRHVAPAVVLQREVGAHGLLELLGSGLRW